MTTKSLLCAFTLSSLSFFAALSSMGIEKAADSKEYTFFSKMSSHLDPFTPEASFNAFLAGPPKELAAINIDALYELKDGRVESIRTDYAKYKSRNIESYEFTISKASLGANSAHFETFKKRCAAVEEAFNKAGKPLEKSRSLFGAGKSPKSPGSRRRGSTFTAKHGLFALTSVVALAAGAIALHFFLDGKHAKAKNAV